MQNLVDQYILVNYLKEL